MIFPNEFEESLISSMNIIDRDELLHIIEDSISTEDYESTILQKIIDIIKSQKIVQQFVYERKPIPGWEEDYEVDSLGRVFSRTRVRKDKDGKERIVLGKELSQSTSKGYKFVTLVDEDRKKIMLVHRLVAEAFVYNPDPEKFDCVNHKDENKINNIYLNLEWCTRRYNSLYGTAIERSREKRIGQKKKKDPRKKVYSRNKTTGEITQYSSVTEASDKTGASRANIVAVCNGKRKSANNFEFSFKKY